MAEKRAGQARGWSWKRGRAAALLCLLVAALLVRPGLVPNTPGRMGSLLETFLPWLGLAVPVLLLPALLRRSFLASAALLLPVAAWFTSFGGLLSTGGQAPDGAFTVVQHNVSDVNPDPAATARALAATDADLIALEELTAPALPAFEAAMAADHPYHATRGTVGLWSKHPLTGIRLVDIRPEGAGEGWNRGLRATARTPQGEIAVYVAHLPSVRIAPATGLASGRRDESAALLGEAIAAEPLDRVILLGDLNGTVDDRGLEPVSSLMDPPGPGFAFSWPAKLPVARIDQVLTRSATVTRVRALPATGSDHLPVAADLSL
ncbi:MAG TPA: endonuclease/exonuclease/phosphatase family protein [Streptomyces sp.]|uniref:endonuclease/exonuclease/phosphatase family protein n=1 Tax=Streptomyces sp. TaxID=1931 RepID=UPI002C1690DE|nr:endonuclease/exonuclease/phosphatase family protein [Streptomyces sp.]HWU05063.1 endonuclease/exonuclease/phosphatase family protein [Streptomyces sp.]